MHHAFSRNIRNSVEKRWAPLNAPKLDAIMTKTSSDAVLGRKRQHPLCRAAFQKGAAKYMTLQNTPPKAIAFASHRFGHICRLFDIIFVSCGRHIACASCRMRQNELGEVPIADF